MKREPLIHAPALRTGMTASHGLCLALFAFFTVLAFVTSNFGFGVLAVLYGVSFVYQWGRYELYEDRLVVRRLWKTRAYRLEGAWLCRDSAGGLQLASLDGVAALTVEPKRLDEFTSALSRRLPVRSRVACMGNLPDAANRGLLDTEGFRGVAAVFVVAGLACLCLLLLAGYMMTAVLAVEIGPVPFGVGLLTIVVGVGCAALGLASLAILAGVALHHAQSVQVTAGSLSLRTLLRRRTIQFADVSAVQWRKRGHDFEYVVSAGDLTVRLSRRIDTFSAIARLIEEQTGLHAAHGAIALPAQTERPRLSFTAVVLGIVGLLCVFAPAPAAFMTHEMGWFALLALGAALGLLLIIACLALWLTWDPTWAARFEGDGITVTTWFAEERIEPPDIMALELAGNVIRITLPDKTVHVTTRKLPYPPVVFCKFLRAHYGVPEFVGDDAAKSRGPVGAENAQPV